MHKQKKPWPPGAQQAVVLRLMAKGGLKAALPHFPDLEDCSGTGSAATAGCTCHASDHRPTHTPSPLQRSACNCRSALSVARGTECFDCTVQETDGLSLEILAPGAGIPHCCIAKACRVSIHRKQNTPETCPGSKAPAMSREAKRTAMQSKKAGLVLGCGFRFS